MPNIPPKGLGGWPKAAGGVAALPAREVWGCLPGETLYRKATMVYGAKADGAWEMIFADNARAPASATATVEASASNIAVRVNWVESSPRVADRYVVTRADGSVVADVPYSTLTVTDTDPRVGSQTYRVTAQLLGVAGGYATSNAVVLGDAPTWGSAVWDTTNLRINLNVTLPGNANGIRYYRVGEGTHWWQGTAIAPSSTRTGDYDGTPTRGAVVTERACSLVNGREASCANSAAVSVPPKVTRPQSWAASGISNLAYTFYGPDAGVATDYELQYYNAPNGGPWTGWTTTTSGGPHNLGTTQAHYVRSRTRAPGGVSDWAQSGPATPVNDVTGPGAPNITVWQPEASYGRMVVRWNAPGDADVVRGQAWWSVGSGWNLWWDGNSWPGAAHELAANFSSGQTVSVLVRAYDANGNQGADAIRSWLIAPSAAYFDPIDGGTGRQLAWRNDGIAGPYSLVHGRTSSGENIAVMFYGTALHDFLAQPGRTFVDMYVEYWRYDDQGSSACISPALYVHDQAYASGAPPWFGNAAGGGTIGDTGGPVCNCVARHTGMGPVETTQQLGWQWWQWLGGPWYGLAFYRATGTNGPDNAASFYMKLANVGSLSPSGSRICGRVWVYCLG